MGGCRCTYRTCSIRSDGKTHMFHYPVFDKIRCYQWLANAQRLDFLNLKVSQLKNRVVCQHHFENDCFMNYKKDTLKYNAIPTKNGSYCDPSSDIELPEETVPITLEDIEAELLCCGDKKANYSVKYSDFLTSSVDLIEPITLNVQGNIPVSMQKQQTILNHCIPTVTQNKQYKSPTTTKMQQIINYSKNQMQPLLIVPPFSNEQCKTVEPQAIDNIQCEIETDKKPVVNYETSVGNNSQTSKQINKAVPINRNNKIKIISEKKISAPLSVIGKLEPVSPSSVIFPRVRNKQPEFTNKENIQSSNDIKIEFFEAVENEVDKIFTKQSESTPFLIKDNTGLHIEVFPLNVNNSFVQPLETESLEVAKVQNNLQSISIIEPQTHVNETCEKQSLQAEQQITPLYSENNQNDTVSHQSTLPNATLKSKIPPERIAVIEEKRKFNKKLRDMIEFCLDDLDDHKQNYKNNLGKDVIANNDHTKLEQYTAQPKRSIVKNTATDPISNKNVTKNQKSHSVVHDIKSNSENYLSKKPSLPDLATCNMSAITARIQRMEDTLLRKIDQNTKKISELKDSLNKSTTEKKSTPTQTKLEDESVYKKQLFQEISQFLSADAKSLIYGELFLNMYTKNLRSKEKSIDEVIQPPKRRRYR